VLLVDDVYTLTNVIIANFIQVDLVSRVAFSCGVATTIMVQVKDGLYYNQLPMDMFLPLAMKDFGCLHQ
jgi:hypothetical protein